MRKYTNQNLSAAEAIARDGEDCQGNLRRRFPRAIVRPTADRGRTSLVRRGGANESAVTEIGTGQLADSARDLVRRLRRDVATDWISRDDMRAKLRSIL